jgi:error-prone DNA polymerase
MYAELHALSCFSFLRGASQPEELVAQAAWLGYRALALTDECSLAGIVRAHVAAKQCGLHLLTGSELRLADGLKVVALATSRTGYGALCRLISHGRRAAAKGSYALQRADLDGALAECLLIWLPPAAAATHGAVADGAWLRERFAGRLWIGVELLTSGSDARRLAELTALGARLGLPCVAAGDVHMHRRSRRALQDVLTAIRLNTSVDAAGFALFPNGERCLRPLNRLAGLYPPPLIAATLEIAARCRFSLDELRYEYPEEIVPP